MLIRDKINEIAREMYKFSGYIVEDKFDFLRQLTRKKK